jgi:hypothetical protein
MREARAMPLDTKHRLIPSLGINTYLDANGAVLDGRNGHAAPGADGRASLSVAQSRTGHFLRHVWRKAARLNLRVLKPNHASDGNDGHRGARLGACGRKIEQWITRSNGGQIEMIRKLPISGVLLTALYSTTALAADLPSLPPPVPYVPAYSWTGLYLGANVGFGGDRFVYPFSAVAVGGGAAFAGSFSITSGRRTGRRTSRLQLGVPQ